MTEKKLVVVVGDRVGKTTLVNALMQKDILPQTANGYEYPTHDCVCLRMTERVYLTDTPGYDLIRYKIPWVTADAVSRADTVIVMLTGESCMMSALDPDAPAMREREAMLLEKLLELQKNRDVYFVIPFDLTDWDDMEVPRDQWMMTAREAFSRFTDHGEAGFFCIDPMLALIGALETDRQELEDSGILPLRAALTGEDGSGEQV